MKNKTMLGLLVLGAMSASMAIAATGEVSLEGVKCLLQAKRDAKVEKAAKWKDGSVYFCCDNCLGKFTKMSDEEKSKLAAKANTQLVATKQYEQEACPFTGGKLNPEAKIKVEGAEVAFCCNNCKGKAEALTGDEQLEKIFGEDAFKKGKFKLVKKEDPKP